MADFIFPKKSSSNFIKLFNQEILEEIRENKEKIDTQKIYLEVKQARLDLWNPCSQFSKDSLLRLREQILQKISYLECSNDILNNRIITDGNKRRRC